MSAIGYLTARVLRRLDHGHAGWSLEDAHRVRDLLRFAACVGRAIDTTGVPPGWDEVAERYRELESDQP